MVMAGSKRRAGWAAADQIVSSFTNFGMSFAVLRTASISDFGIFSIVYAVYVLSTAAGRALVGQPVAVLLSEGDPLDRRAQVGSACWSAATLGFVIGATVITGSLGVGAELRTPLLIVGLAMPLLLLQDARRFGHFALGEPQNALFSDLVWGVGQALALLTIVLTTDRSISFYVAGWAISGALASLLPVKLRRPTAGFATGISWLRATRRLGLRFLAEGALQAGAMQTVLLGTAAIAGLAEIGLLNGARTLFGPITVLLLGAEMFGVPEGVRLADSEHALARLVNRTALLLTFSPLILASLLWWIPEREMVRAIGSSWEDMRPVVPFVGLFVSMQGLGWAYRIGLRALADARSSLAAQMRSGPLIVVLGLCGAASSGSVGAAIGLAVAQFLSAIWFRGKFHTSLRQHVLASGPEIEP